MWADHLGIPRLTLFAALGASIVIGEHHQDPMKLFRPHIDVDAESAALIATGRSWHAAAEDLYPDALPCLRALGELGYRLGVAANQPAEVADMVRSMGIELDLVGMSAAWRLHKPDPHKALGPDLLQQLSQKSGVSVQDLAQRLSQVLPQAVDTLTPDGQLPKA